MRLVVDTGPLIALSKTGHLELLPKLFTEVVVPEEVFGEIAGPGEIRPGSEIQDRAWVTRRGVHASARLELQRACDISAGEAEAILLAAQAPDASVLLVDDTRARRIAFERGVRTLRTGALLVAAVRPGLLQPDDIRRAVWILQRERYLDPRAAQDILALLAK